MRNHDLARINQRQDMRMLQLGGDPDLAQESFGAEHRGEFGMQHLHRHLPIVLDVVRQENRGHPTAADLPLDRICPC